METVLTSDQYFKWDSSLAFSLPFALDGWRSRSAFRRAKCQNTTAGHLFFKQLRSIIWSMAARICAPRAVGMNEAIALWIPMQLLVATHTSGFAQHKGMSVLFSLFFTQNSLILKAGLIWFHINVIKKSYHNVWCKCNGHKPQFFYSLKINPKFSIACSR